MKTKKSLIRNLRYTSCCRLHGSYLVCDNRHLPSLAMGNLRPKTSSLVQQIFLAEHIETNELSYELIDRLLYNLSRCSDL